MKTVPRFLVVALVLAANLQDMRAHGRTTVAPLDHLHLPVSCIWRPLPSALEAGLLRERVELWEQNRLWYMVTAEDDYLLSGFESRPGRHPWQGEHVGKWLHAATLAYERTRDPKLGKTLKEVVDRLLATQEQNGYLGTYAFEDTFMAMPENKSILKVADDVAPTGKDKKNAGGWDTWTFRYNLYGLLTYEKFHPDPRVVEACRKMGDLLLRYYGQGKYDLTKYGTRHGISATTLLESIVMLYERTGDRKYLDFARHIVVMSEENPLLRLMGTMLDNGSVVKPGDGKAYQLMSNLLGYSRLYECTGDERYLKAVETAWAKIHTNHTYVTGGPWGIKRDYNANRECFAYARDFGPEDADVETCSTTTWIQMNLQLLELTGESRYAAEAEKAFFNALIAAQYPEGINWCYYTKADAESQPYEPKITCCASSGPRALEVFARHLVGEAAGALSFASLVPCRAALSEAFGHAKIRIEGSYPVAPFAAIRFEQASGKTFPVEFREPAGAHLAEVRINGKKVESVTNGRGFHRITRSWKRGDEITVKFEYRLASHLESPKKGSDWVAFTYGPWALARQIKKGTAFNQPFAGEDVSGQPATHWLEPAPAGPGGLPHFRIKGTDIVLEPYFATGSLETGPQTYFSFTNTGH
jgi:DUF1680 family protein